MLSSVMLSKIRLAMISISFYHCLTKLQRSDPLELNYEKFSIPLDVSLSMRPMGLPANSEAQK